MKHLSSFPVILLISTVAWMYTAQICVAQQSSAAGQNPKSVLIIYHVGSLNTKPSPPLEQTDVDALTQSTTKQVNMEKVAEAIRDRLTSLGYRVDLIKATELTAPQKFVEYNGIIFGTPTWFSNVAYPIKKVFDEQLHRLYQQRKGRLNDKVLSGYTTAMSRGEDGPDCLQALTRSMKHLSNQIIDGMVINTGDDTDTVNAAVRQFCDRFAQALK